MPSGKQARHVGDGCIEDVEDELRRDADGKHEQSDRNDDEFLASQKVRKRSATLSERTAEERGRSAANRYADAQRSSCSMFLQQMIRATGRFNQPLHARHHQTYP